MLRKHVWKSTRRVASFVLGGGLTLAGLVLLGILMFTNPIRNGPESGPTQTSAIGSPTGSTLPVGGGGSILANASGDGGTGDEVAVRPLASVGSGDPCLSMVTLPAVANSADSSSMLSPAMVDSAPGVPKPPGLESMWGLQDCGAASSIARLNVAAFAPENAVDNGSGTPPGDPPPGFGRPNEQAGRGPQGSGGGIPGGGGGGHRGVGKGGGGGGGSGGDEPAGSGGPGDTGPVLFSNLPEREPPNYIVKFGPKPPSGHGQELVTPLPAGFALMLAGLAALVVHGHRQTGAARLLRATSGVNAIAGLAD